LNALLDRRTKALDRLDQVRDDKFIARQEAVKSLNAELGPRIRLGVHRGGQFDIYASALANILKGSGLRYGDLSVQIAQRVSPRELMEAADQNSVSSFAQSAEIAEDRAARLLAQVQSSDLGELAAVVVEDDVQLQLLDGTVYKDIADLSTGQRCTVVLPIVLRHTDRMLIVDQPEDHIDNAFIAETLIRAITARSEEGQLLFSTHNANIPVLGNADRVVQLASDGKRGFVVRAARLDDVHIISAITTVMEGGPDAFRRRSEFYSKNFCI
jgi:translation initiation factor RLI1